MESDGSQTAAGTDALTVQNCIMAGIRGDNFIQDPSATVMTAATMENWYKATARHNKVYTSNTDVKITDPFNFASPNFQPSNDSPVQKASYWFTTGVDPVKANEASVKSYPIHSPVFQQLISNLKIQNMLEQLFLTFPVG